MEKMRFETIPETERNARRIAGLFPNCVREEKNSGGTVEKKIDFEMLKQMLTGVIAEAPERYEFTWPGKKKAVWEANQAVRMTLRPDVKKSLGWDTARNLYIEGDNLSVLKLLQESYLGKVRMIYIDPPYNTGSDFIYRDDFRTGGKEYESSIGLYSEEGLKLYKNTEFNGRFHSDWCSMIYPRLMLARNLLTEDGVIFISIDDHEQANLKKICDEIFGEANCIGEIIRKTKSMTADRRCGFNLQHETLLAYAKDSGRAMLRGEEKSYEHYSNPDNDPNGDWCAGDPSAKSGGPSTYFEIENPYTHRKDLPPLGRYWAFSEETMKRYVREGRIRFKESYRDGERGFVFKRYKKDAASTFGPVHSLFGTENIYMNQAATTEAKKIFGEDVFSYPKPAAFIRKLVQYATEKDSVVLDFFSGSATTAQAVMEQNAADGGCRRFIMVQVPEPVGADSGAGRAGYQTLCDVGRERIRRTAEKLGKSGGGYRTFYLDDTNMKDVYYAAGDYTQELLKTLESNIRPDRTDEDLLFGCLLEWGLALELPYASESFEGYRIYNYNRGELIACFGENIPEAVVRHMAGQRPLRAVFRDSCFSGSPEKINAAEQFRRLSPKTRVKVI